MEAHILRSASSRPDLRALSGVKVKKINRKQERTACIWMQSPCNLLSHRRGLRCNGQLERSSEACCGVGGEHQSGSRHQGGLRAARRLTRTHSR